MKLIDELRRPIKRHETYYEALCNRAADELERLKKELKEAKHRDMRDRLMGRSQR